MWVNVLKDYDHRASPISVVAYTKGTHVNAVKAHVEAAPEGTFEVSDHKGQSGDVTDGTQEPRTKVE